MVLAGRPLRPLEEVAQTAATERAHPFSADVGQPEAVDGLLAVVKERFEQLNLLFNNAGLVTAAVSIEDFPLTQFKPRSALT